jgi:trans-aconitate methyltransferase
MTGNQWSSESYQQNAAYVPALGAAVLELLAPKPGERILDIGCGDGALTEQIVAAGAATVGVDASPPMIAAARARGLDARLVNAQELRFDREFDGAFSNAALHWVHDHDALLDGVRRALRPGGRFVAEFGGHGNISAIEVAVRAALERRNLGSNVRRYYPTDDEYAARLSAHGFDVQQIALIPRPTPLPTGMRGWLETFERSTLDRLPEGERAGVIDDIERLLRPAVCDSKGRWTAQYVRLRFRATST